MTAEDDAATAHVSHTQVAVEDMEVPSVTEAGLIEQSPLPETSAVTEAAAAENPIVAEVDMPEGAVSPAAAQRGPKSKWVAGRPWLRSLSRR